MNSEESTVISFRFFCDPVSSFHQQILSPSMQKPPRWTVYGTPFFICHGDTRYVHFDAGDPVLPPDEPDEQSELIDKPDL